MTNQEKAALKAANIPPRYVVAFHVSAMRGTADRYNGRFVSFQVNKVERTEFPDLKNAAEVTLEYGKAPIEVEDDSSEL